MSHFVLRRFKVIPDLHLRLFFYTWAAFDYFFSYSNLIIYPPAIFPSSQNWEKARREWQFWLEGKLTMVWGRRWGLFQKLSFFLSSGLGSKGLKKDWTPSGNTLGQLNLDLMDKSFVFVRARGVSIIWEWPSCIVSALSVKIHDYQSSTQTRTQHFPVYLATDNSLSALSGPLFSSPLCFFSNCKI